MQCNLERLDDKIKTFAKFGDTGKGGVTRFSLSPEALQARAEFVRRMEKIGATVEADDMANLYATIPGSEILPAIAMGSHLDSVRQGGNFDGVLGVLAAMEVLETVVTEGIPHRRPLTAMVWTNEEGARFEPAMMSSGVICHKFDKERMLASVAKDIPGYTFGQALAESGYIGSEANRLSAQRFAAMLELHIEQGPVMDTEGYDVGVVGGVCGMINYEFTLTGQANHAGTTPMPYRRDALYAACKVIQRLHDELDKLDPALVYTTGKISAHPNIHTIIPDEVKFTLDARHYDPAVIEQVLSIIRALPAEVERCGLAYTEAWSRKSVAFAKPLVETVAASADKLGYRSIRMYSGPGHDAQFAADILPTAMIFVPSEGGYSHCEQEFTATEKCLKGVNVLLHTVLALDESL